MTLSYNDVAEIVKIIDASNCDEISLEVEGARISIRRNTSGGPVPDQSPIAPASTVPATAPTPSPQQANNQASEQISDQVSHKGQRVPSPMTGTFFTSPAPTEPEFAPVGAHVDKGAPLCVIEVMKLFTTIKAPCAGCIEAVLVQNGELVEYDQPLFVIRPD